MPRSGRPDPSWIGRSATEKAGLKTKGPRPVRLDDGELDEIPIRWQQLYPDMTLPEAKIMDAFEKHGYRLNQHYLYQSDVFGGRNPSEIGGAIVDFVYIDTWPILALPVNGNYWHYKRGWKRIERDIFVLRKLIQEKKWDVVVLDEDDIDRLGAWNVLRMALFLRRDISQLAGKI